MADGTIKKEEQSFAVTLEKDGIRVLSTNEEHLDYKLAQDLTCAYLPHKR